MLVGRQEELALLEDSLRSAIDGMGQFALLAGEAGVGKSRLCRALTEQAESLGLTVVLGACSETDLALPYLPFVEAIDGGRLRPAPHRRGPAVG